MTSLKIRLLPHKFQTDAYVPNIATSTPKENKTSKELEGKASTADRTKCPGTVGSTANQPGSPLSVILPQ